MAAEAKDIRGAVRAGPACAPLVGAANIANKGTNGDVALNGTVPDGVEATASDSHVWLTRTACHGARREAAVRPAGPSERVGRCSR
jgi:hypothetical protein